MEIHSNLPGELVESGTDQMYMLAGDGFIASVLTTAAELMGAHVTVDAAGRQPGPIVHNLTICMVKVNSCFSPAVGGIPFEW
ncbi:MAG: hypothetical protein GY820_42355 [Gammaproteobacteria bacterium]|nr:hypothetical protein [Gammaproteobacteria bacterium]